MASLIGRSTARVAPGVEPERGDNLRSPEQLEAEATAEVRGYEKVMQARVEEAFPEKSDPIRLYGEGLAQGGVAFVRSMSKLTAAAESRLRNLLTAADQTAQAQFKASTARTEADRAAAKLEAVQAVRAGLSEIVAVDRRARYGWAAGVAGLGIVAAFGLGMLTEHWRDRASTTGDAASKLAELRAEAAMATTALATERERLGEISSDMKQAVADAGAGLSVLRTLGNLPDAERAAMNGILDALAGAANGSKPSPQLQAVRELMALRPVERLQVLEFAKTGDAKFRSDFLPVIRLAEARSRTAWWAGETVYPGCITNGPVLAAQGGGGLRTCLVQIPDTWGQSDAYLRNRHYGLSVR